jgi:pSer/pThr/pTyr-binding forkhead associated (FHA) protein
VIRIGRSEQNDVVVGDPLVSRAHAELTSHSDGWKIASLGRHGTLIDGRLVTGDAFVKDHSVIQLGINGPAIEFRRGHTRVDTLATLTNLNVAAVSQLRVDDEKTRAEVSKITDGEVFKKLQQQAEDLKKQRDANAGSETRFPGAGDR